nr:contractile injection system protein, VgrG/Pvc8 family [Pseudomonas amygdali]
MFSDDSASFPAQPVPLRFKRQEQSGTSTGTLLHMAEVLTLPGVSRQPAPGLKQTQPPSSKHDENARTPAANHAFQPSGVLGPISQEEALGRQRGMRELERLRCERREVSGHSNRSGLRSGEVIQVLDHPEPLLNDQWLLTEVLHAGRQLQVLRGATAHDALAILRILTDEQRSSPAAAQLSGNGYGNRFKAIPWAMPFRPSARHPSTGRHRRSYSHAARQRHVRRTARLPTGSFRLASATPGRPNHPALADGAGGLPRDSSVAAWLTRTGPLSGQSSRAPGYLRSPATG